MALTDTTKVFIPDVYADMQQAAFIGAVKVAGSEAVVRDDTLEGAPGETVTFPKWDAIGELDDLTEGTPMVPVAMGVSDSTATIKEAGKAVEITDKAELTGLGSAAQEARRQFGILAARKVDADLITEAQRKASGDNPFEYATPAGGTLDWSTLLQAIGKFGDEWEPSDFAGLYVRSEQWGQIAATDQFTDASKLGGPTPLRTGQVGVFGGVPVYLTNRLASTKALLLKKNSLGLLYKRRPIIEQDRDILKRTDVITTNLHYAVKRLNNKGVCVITVTAGTP